MLVNPKKCFDKKISVKEQFLQSFKIFIRNKKLRKCALLQIFSNSFQISAFRFEGAYFEKLVPLYFVNVARIMQNCFGWLSFYLVGLVEKFSLFKILYYSILGSAVFRLTALLMNNTITHFLMPRKIFRFRCFCFCNIIAERIQQKPTSNIGFNRRFVWRINDGSYRIFIWSGRRLCFSSRYFAYIRILQHCHLHDVWALT